MSPERQGLREKWASISFEKKVAMFIAPVFVAVVTGVTGVGIARLAADGSGPGQETVVRAKPKVAIVEIEPSVTLAEFRAREAGGGGPAVLGRFNPREIGTVFYVRVDLGDIRRVYLSLRWFAYDAVSHRRVPGVRLSAYGGALFRPHAPINTQIAQLWLPDPSRPGQYFARVELYADNVLVDFANSKRYEVIHP